MDRESQTRRVILIGERKIGKSFVGNLLKQATTLPAASASASSSAPTQGLNIVTHELRPDENLTSNIDDILATAPHSPHLVILIASGTDDSTDSIQNMLQILQGSNISSSMVHVVINNADSNLVCTELATACGLNINQIIFVPKNATASQDQVRQDMINILQNAFPVSQDLFAPIPTITISPPTSSDDDEEDDDGNPMMLMVFFSFRNSRGFVTNGIIVIWLF